MLGSCAVQAKAAPSPRFLGSSGLGVRLRQPPRAGRDLVALGAPYGEGQRKLCGVLLAVAASPAGVSSGIPGSHGPGANGCTVAAQ